METKFTKGEWKVLFHEEGDLYPFIQSVNGMDRRFICDVKSSHLRENIHANAKLIAAAPDLLDALISILEKSEPALEHCYQQDSETIDVVIKAKQSIKKATE